MVREEESVLEVLQAEISRLQATATSLKHSNEQLFRRTTDQDTLLLLQKNELSFARTEARSYKEQFHSFLNLAPACIAVLGGSDFIVEQVNPHFQALFPGRNWLGRPAMDAFPDTHSRPVWAILQHVFQTGITFEGKELLFPLVSLENGPVEKRYYNFIYQARFDLEHKVNGILIFAFEVTATVNSRLSSEENEQRLHLILNAVPQIIWTNDHEGNITFVNQRWYEYTGYEVRNDLNALWFSTIHPEDLEEVKRRISCIQSDDLGGVFEFRRKRKDGQYRWMLSRIESVKNEKGKVLFWIGSSTDIEELKKLQRQKDDFINLASHELKTPLTSLKVAIQLIDEQKEQLSPAMFNRLIHRASSSMDKIIVLVDDLLNVGRFSQGQFELNRSWFLVPPLLEVYTNSLAGAGNRTLVFTGDTDMQLFADASRIEQVFINIINNAIRYAPESTEINVHLERTSGFMKVSVSDKGPGILPELIPLLFDRSYRVVNTDHTGSGLGLYICAEIIKKHGGEIDVISRPGSGTTFWFSIPIPLISIDLNEKPF